MMNEDDKMIQLGDINNTHALAWAFEKGYRLGLSDVKNGIHIRFDETMSVFLSEITELNTINNTRKSVLA